MMITLINKSCQILLEYIHLKKIYIFKVNGKSIFTIEKIIKSGNYIYDYAQAFSGENL